MPQKIHLSKEVVESGLEEMFAAVGIDFIFGVRLEEVAHAASHGDDAALLKVFVGFQHRVGVDGKVSAELAYRRHTSALAPLLRQYGCKSVVDDLPVNRFVRFKIHNLRLDGDGRRG